MQPPTGKGDLDGHGRSYAPRSYLSFHTRTLRSISLSPSLVCFAGTSSAAPTRAVAESTREGAAAAMTPPVEDVEDQG
jgi:hypothetical protein